MKALISPIENVQYISGWNNPIEPSELYTPIFTVCGERIVQVEENEFPVALPLFWLDCGHDVTPSINCYDAKTQTFILIPPNVPNPNPEIPKPISTGTKQA